MAGSNKAGDSDRPKRRPAASLPAISKRTADLLLKQQRPVDKIALYFFYLDTAAWQHTNRPKATTNFCARGLKISQTRVRAAKRCLLNLDLIADYVHRDTETGRVLGHYVHVKYIRSGDHQPVDLPQSGSSNPMAEQQPNASIASKENALIAYKQNASSASNVNASIVSRENALNTPYPLSGGKRDNKDSFTELAEKLLICLNVDPPRFARSAELSSLRQVRNHVDARAFQRVRWFYWENPPHPCFDPNRSFLRYQKLTLWALASDRPQQLALVAQWETTGESL